MANKSIGSRLKGFIHTSIVSILLFLGQWWAQVKGYITSTNADILLVIAVLLFIFGAIYMLWPLLVKFLSYIKRLRIIFVPEKGNQTKYVVNINNISEQLSNCLEEKHMQSLQIQSMFKQIENTQKQSYGAIEFYPSRQALITKRGTMFQELDTDKAQKVWVAWWTGTSASTHRLYAIQRNPPINRMILLNPGGDYINSHARIEDRKVSEIQADIIHTIGLFHDKGVDIRFFEGYIESMIIVDPINSNDDDKFSDKSWIRIEPCEPYKDTVNACNYVIYKNKNLQLFNALLSSYEFLWGKSVNQPKHRNK